MSTLARELKRSIRLLTRSPSFTTVAVLTLGLGIGANTAIFTVLNAVVLRPLPYLDPDRLATIWATIPDREIWEEGISYLTFQDWRNRNRSFDEMAIVSRDRSMTIRIGEEYERVRAGRVSTDFFRVMGVPPVKGRSFSREEEEARVPVAVISHGLWQRAFGGADDVLGRSVETPTGGLEIIGIAPSEFRFPDHDTDLWVSHTTASYWPEAPMVRHMDTYGVVGRLKPGETTQSAQQDLDSVMSGLTREFPADYLAPGGGHIGVRVVGFADEVISASTRSSLWILLGAASLVLLIACANISGLFLARGLARQHDRAIRRALGASRSRLLGAQMAESGVVLVLAATVGLGIAYWGTEALVALAPTQVHGIHSVGVDPIVLGFSALVLVITGILFSAIPAWISSKSDPNEALRRGTNRSASSSPTARRASGALVVGEFALAIVLLVGSGLLIRSFLALERVDPGFTTENLLTFEVSLASRPTQQTGNQTVVEILQRIEALPGVISAGAINSFNYAGWNPDATTTIEGKPPPSPTNPQPPLMFSEVRGDFFRTAGVPLLRGRAFSAGDSAQNVRSVIVNKTFEDLFFDGENPIGRRVTPGRATKDSLWFTVVGVVGDMRRQGLSKQPLAQIFLPRGDNSTLDIVVHTSLDPANLAASVRSTVRAVDSTIPRFEISTMQHEIWAMGAQRRLETGLLTLLAASALALSAIGIYSLTSQDVRRRTREIGIRTALGAQPREVARMVVRQGVALALIGGLLGVLAAIFLASLLAGLLYEVEPADPLTMVLASVIMVLVAALACYLPARRAAGVDPLTALRQD